ncbi:MAG: HlyD family efflux transporter periplasmic adaptor subunit [Planctomycetales bacterium]|nr:HlyD family efflux transporter periplasmic adaptor subunit [Planctomycetales bacterium]
MSDHIEQTKQQIRALVNEIAQISKSDLGADDYYPQFLDRVVQALAALGGAVWMFADGQQLTLKYQINVSDSLLDDNDDSRKHRRLLAQVSNGNEGHLIPPQSGTAEDGSAGNPTPMLLVLAPVLNDGKCEGVVEIFQRPDAPPSAQRGYRRFLVQMCELFSEWCKGRKLKQFGDRHILWQQADQFSRQIHTTLDLRETCYLVTNEGRRMIGCDRVSVAIKRGPRCRIEAVSGQDTIENRSNVIRHLSDLASKVCATGEPLWWDGEMDDLPPQIEESLDPYVDESYTKMMAILPIRRPKTEEMRANDGIRSEANLENNEANQIIGALIVEQIESDVNRDLLESRVDLVYEHSARALSNSMTHNELFLMPVWRAIGKLSVVTKARNLPKTLAVAAALLLVIGALFFMRTDFRLKAEGALQPIERRDVFVEVPGTVVEVLVKDQDPVQAGAPLIRLSNPEQQRLYQDLLGKIETARVNRDSLARRLKIDIDKLEPADVGAFETQINTTRAELESYLRQKKDMEDNIERLTIRAPINGIVLLSWNIEKSLMGRVVEPGQVMMTVADPTGPWELDLFLLEKRAGYVKQARHEIKPELKVDYFLATNAGEGYEGWVKNVDQVTRMHGEDAQHGVRVQVGFDESNHANPRVGARVTAKIHCGRSSLGFAWFHEAIEWVQGMLF